jgi:hypothetical protein
MKLSQQNNVCECGHFKIDHRNDRYPNLDPIEKNDCRFCWNMKLCKCYNFKLDNLRFLEQKYEEKTIEV